jgi:hypothetical protein
VEAAKRPVTRPAVRLSSSSSSTCYSTALLPATSDSLKFVPALNARSLPPLTSVHHFTKEHQDRIVLALLFSHQILFSVLNEMFGTSCQDVNWICADTAVGVRVCPDTITREQQPELNGCTSPWNTFALWDLRKLADIFVSTDYCRTTRPIRVLVLKKSLTCLQLLGPDQAKSKLVQLTSEVDWNQAFDDPKRTSRKWPPNRPGPTSNWN